MRINMITAKAAIDNPTIFIVVLEGVEPPSPDLQSDARPSQLQYRLWGRRYSKSRADVLQTWPAPWRLPHLYVYLKCIH